ncbi:MAG: hypothetical protein HZA27_03610, partial [Candidatus Omnitrophica bacterium]|nr:hypothetical protein [Candidatus Omnitrophota bacterium]
TLNQETLFVAKDERIGNFKLKDFSDEQIILENTDSGQETAIKRQELIAEENQKEEIK